jgi:YebC/PmpR family DNA-binding regulatory protein
LLLLLFITMSGHSKWSKVKHQKATTDVVKAAAFTKASRGITLAVRQGGGISDPEMNFKLRLAIEKAKAVNMPKENIERALEKGKGVGAGDIEQVLYEAFGPYGSAMLIEAATDNKQRTVSKLKNILEHHGGTLAAQGAVSYMFKQSGVIVVPKFQSYDEMLNLALELGADDLSEFDMVYEVYTKATELAKVKKQFEAKKVSIENSELVMLPINPITLIQSSYALAEALVDQLNEIEDIQNVFTNIISA